MATQYLTAVFELRPSRRQAAALERVRAAYEAIFWDIIDGQRTRADELVALTNKKERKAAMQSANKEIAKIIDSKGRDLAEPVRVGLVRDVEMAIGSYVELRVGGHKAEWPTRKLAIHSDLGVALGDLAASTTKEAEGEARDAMSLATRFPGPRPMTIARERDARLIRKSQTGPIAAVLNVLRKSDPRAKAKTATIQAGIDASTGETIKPMKSATRLVMPVACSRWHENKFLGGKAVLRSSLIHRCDDRWFLHAQFEFTQPERFASKPKAWVGVDRGIVNPIAVAVVSGTGAVCAVSTPMGAEIGQSIRKADKKRKAEQERRGTTSLCHVARVDHELHRLANHIVATAKEYGAGVVLEKLDGLKQTIVAQRPKGSRKGGWRRTLKRAQLGKLEQMLAYKMALAGLPPKRSVRPGGTSQTCPACAQRDPKNRRSQDEFRCTACGFSAHADTIGAVNIARRGVVMVNTKEGDKLQPIEQDMVRRLRATDDSGLGPLVGLLPASGFVAGRASGDTTNDGGNPAYRALGQKESHATENTLPGVLAQRGGAFFSATETEENPSISIGSKGPVVEGSHS